MAGTITIERTRGGRLRLSRRFFKTDHARTIDRFIDYFGEGRRLVPAPASRRAATAAWRSKVVT